MRPLHYLAALLVAPVAAVVAWSMGDARGVGVAAGVALALAISIAGWVAQERALRKRTADANAAMTAFALTFLVKLFAVATGAVVLRMNETLGAACDWRAYLVGFAASVAWVLFVGAFRRSAGARRTEEASVPC